MTISPYVLLHELASGPLERLFTQQLQVLCAQAWEDQDKMMATDAPPTIFHQVRNKKTPPRNLSGFRLLHLHQLLTSLLTPPTNTDQQRRVFKACDAIQSAWDSLALANDLMQRPRTAQPCDVSADQCPADQCPADQCPAPSAQRTLELALELL